MINLMREKKNGSNGQGEDSTPELTRVNGKGKGQSFDYMEVLPVPVVVIGRDFRVRYANAAGAGMLGCTTHSCQGQKCAELFKFKTCSTADCQAAKAFADGKTYSSEVVVKSPKGDMFFRCYTVPLKDGRGNVTGALEYFIDATRELTFALEAGNVFSGVSLGKPDGRVNYKQFDGVLRKVAKGINLCLDGLLGLHMGHHVYFVKIAAGEHLDHWKSQEETAHGIWKEQFVVFNEFIDSINGLMDEVDMLTRSAAEGNLKVRGDSSKFKGAWAKMVNGMNSVLDAVVNPLNAVSDLLVQQSNYDLTVQLEGEFKGDLVVLRDAAIRALRHQVESMQLLKRISAELAESGTDLSQASQQAQQAAQQIANASQQVATGAGDQATALQDTMKAIDQLIRAIDQIARGAQEQSQLIEKNVNMVGQVSGSITQVSSNTAQAASNARSATETARKGTDMVQKTIKGMEDIRATIDVVSEKVSTLGTRSREIGKIIATINDIADQTNLLALNAAIEAARAGEQGRGFAVVADEVRKLAERASTSTKEIEELINNIQNGVQDMVKAMTKGTEEVANGYELATRAGQSLDEILTKSREMGNGVDQISKATQQLKTMSTEMVKLSDNISAIVEENTAATEEMSATAKTVSKSVEEVAGVAEENSAATEEVSAAAGQISAQMQQVVTSGGRLSKVADEFKDIVAKYKMNGK